LTKELESFITLMNNIAIIASDIQYNISIAQVFTLDGILLFSFK